MKKHIDFSKQDIYIFTFYMFGLHTSSTCWWW